MRKFLAALLSLALAAPAWAIPPTVQPPAGQVPFTATGSTTPRTAADRAADVFNAADWGMKCNASDETSKVTPLFNAAAAVNGKVVFPKGTCVWSSYTFPTNSAVEIAGQGMGATTLAQVGGATGDFMAFQPSTAVIHYIHDVKILGTSGAGACIHLLPGDNSSYWRGIWVSRVNMSSCGTYDVQVEDNRGAGLIENSVLQHAGVDAFNISRAPDWRIRDTDFGASSGNCVTAFNASDLRAEGNHFYTCTNGVSVKSPGPAATFWINNSFDTNTQSGFTFTSTDSNGTVLSTAGVPNGTVLIGNRFTANSNSATNTYPDINLVSAQGLVITGNTFFWGSSSQSKYLIQADANTGSITWTLNQWNFVNGTLPYGTAVSNNNNLVGATGTNAVVIPGSSGATATGANSVAGGVNGAAGNTNTIGFGNIFNAGGKQSAVFGFQVYDHGRYGCMVWGNGQFTATGDVGGYRCLLKAKTTDGTTAVTLTADLNSASGNNVLNLTNDNEKMACKAGTVVASNPSTGDYALWNIPAFTIVRGTGAASVSIVGLTSGTQTQTTASAALAGATLSITPDTTNSGISIKGAGVASTSLHWGFMADCLDIQ